MDFSFSLDQLRGIQEGMMPVSATVLRSTQGETNEAGEPIITPSTFALSCRINVSSGVQELSIAEMLGVTQPFTISYSIGITLMATDVVVANGKTYQVMGLVQEQTFETVHRAICKQTR